MGPDLLVPLLLPLASWPVARWVAPRLSPRLGSWLLTSCALVLAAGSTLTLAVLAAAGLAQLPVIGRLGDFSAVAFHGADEVGLPLATGSAVILSGVVAAFLRTAVRYRRWHREVHAELNTHTREAGVVLLPGAEPVAFAVPGGGGRIAVSSGMLAALAPGERCALLAHERAHLRLRHHLFAGAVTIATALNPLLRPLGSAARFALERWADEAAAEHVGDRKLVATAVAKAALAGVRRPSPALAATGGPVPQRVRALLTTPEPGSRRRSLGTIAVAVVLGACAWSATSTLDAATDLHSGIETAQAACVAKAVPSQGTQLQTTSTALGHQDRECAES
ncbi:Zn-dependent protease with chaperone function [Amycolatopsis sulphurea]|uniref:Zn-dependent protease with chaperone function n=1 Tax=Amycolatopsis sulphurea TaxID=76022 RepID=A0A2A9FDX4_9PSEU|nr:M56 family metallopeptidase [Amycolatopsis sulphurea]PFG49358.1 Zn-dependent protease with chaperone function [Amycolatopsis sulphurea]